MPRKQTGEATRILEFFRNADLTVARAMLDVATDLVRTRMPKVRKPENTAAPVAPKTRRKTTDGPGPVSEIGE